MGRCHDVPVPNRRVRQSVLGVAHFVAEEASTTNNRDEGGGGGCRRGVLGGNDLRRTNQDGKPAREAMDEETSETSDGDEV